jgi:Fe2+ transport system protein B
LQQENGVPEELVESNIPDQIQRDLLDDASDEESDERRVDDSVLQQGVKDVQQMTKELKNLKEVLEKKKLKQERQLNGFSSRSSFDNESSDEFESDEAVLSKKIRPEQLAQLNRNNKRNGALFKSQNSRKNSRKNTRSKIDQQTWSYESMCYGVGILAFIIFIMMIVFQRIEGC